MSDYRLLPLSGATPSHALIDLEDAERVSVVSWRHEKDGYVRATFKQNGKKKHVRLHRFILGLGDGKRGGLHVDHINGNKLDNRRCNLRVVTAAENGRNRHAANKNNNTSVHRGVSWDASRHKWKAQVKVDRKGRCLGRFDTEIEAKQAVDSFWKAHWSQKDYFLDKVLERDYPSEKPKAA